MHHRPVVIGEDREAGSRSHADARDVRRIPMTFAIRRSRALAPLRRELADGDVRDARIGQPRDDRDQGGDDHVLAEVLHAEIAGHQRGRSDPEHHAGSVRADAQSSAADHASACSRRVKGDERIVRTGAVPLDRRPEPGCQARSRGGAHAGGGPRITLGSRLHEGDYAAEPRGVAPSGQAPAASTSGFQAQSIPCPGNSHVASVLYPAPVTACEGSCSRIMSRAQVCVVFENQDWSSECGETLISENRPLTALDVDLCEVGAIEIREDVDSVDLVISVRNFDPGPRVLAGPKRHTAVAIGRRGLNEPPIAGARRSQPSRACGSLRSTGPVRRP